MPTAKPYPPPSQKPALRAPTKQRFAPPVIVLGKLILSESFGTRCNQFIMKNQNQIVQPTATQYLDCIQSHINILRSAPVVWEPEDISSLHEVDDILLNIIQYFEDMSDQDTNRE